MLDRVSTSGKFFRVNGTKWYVKGFSYGPFAPDNHCGQFLPARDQISRDFAQMSELGANCLRVYHRPPEWFLDEAFDAGLRVFVDVPWEKHRCFFEDWDAQQRAKRAVRDTARLLGGHAGLFGISVANEIPVDIVRFCDHQRVEAFIDQLIDIVKDEAPDCLTTYVNFPTTEFLTPTQCDFICSNVYVHDGKKLGAYLDRLQHMAGDKPLILGEYGVDTIREGDVEQAKMLTDHLHEVFRHGLAGSLVFAFTDDWFTGGHQIEDWAFGVTRRDRSEKVSAVALRQIWKELPDSRTSAWPKVSVVVCSYNGGSTLRACLDSLMKLDYHDYEVILVDDGSTDDTKQIAADFPQVIYHWQENSGLSVARNVGAKQATGQIVAYTDSDCVADEHWLRYLVQAMQDQQVEAIGGPNITPPSDGWVSHSVAVSPGNPSHVMLDDQYAEHVPGCNMAFRRDVLLGLGGFDPQFRQAGDDVDVCWRLSDAGMAIGYAPAAMVWHHRRGTVGAYIRQQTGYGKSEAMVHFKHPRRCGPFGRSTWRGIIYGNGAVGLPLMPETIYHGQFGLAPFQTIYRHNEYGLWSCMMALEWHLLAVFLLLLATLYWPLALLSLSMWSATLVLASRSALNAPLPRQKPWWCRPLVAYLYVIQPIIRGWHRQTHLLRSIRLPRDATDRGRLRQPSKRVTCSQRDVYFESNNNVGRESLLTELVHAAARTGWSGDFDDAWSKFDVKLVGDRWHDIRVRTATEELGWPRRFTRVRCITRMTLFHRVGTTACLIWTTSALISLQPWAMLLGLSASGLVIFGSVRSRTRCQRAVAQLVTQAAQAAGLEPVGPDGKPVDGPACEDSPKPVPPALIRAANDTCSPLTESPSNLAGKDAADSPDSLGHWNERASSAKR